MALQPCRIIVIGVTSSGKSTLALALSRKLNVPFIDSDGLLWEPNWQKAADYVEKMKVATESPTWALAGHARKARDMVFRRADVVVWLDYSLWTVFWQLVRRCLYRWWTNEQLWGTNNESIWTHLKLWSDDSLVHWLFKTYWIRKQEYPASLALYPHLKVFRFRHPRETQAWLDSIDQP
ncbi:hypothetical protein LEN26_017896 [Aphanomyces euteiches]|nr:hypothetical protein LEN26_017896 [Aphanomyces euteiches]KAH9124320.1 hypothetical protein AeMF1_004891 [Aphanomyces euteiches]KAH9185367.1 hypothetical protein AeNC1_012654 [Aphanomyces euteiches]